MKNKILIITLFLNLNNLISTNNSQIINQSLSKIKDGGNFIQNFTVGTAFKLILCGVGSYAGYKIIENISGKYFNDNIEKQDKLNKNLLNATKVYQKSTNKLVTDLTNLK